MGEGAKEFLDKATEKMLKKAEKLKEKKVEISKEVRKKKFVFNTRGKLTKNEIKEIKRTHNNIFDWVSGEKRKEKEKAEFEEKEEAEDEEAMEIDIQNLDREKRLSRVEERKRLFLARKTCKEILDDILTETGRFRVKEMMYNVVGVVLDQVVLQSTVTKMMEEAESQGHAVLEMLERKLVKKRVEEERAVRLILEEGQREERLRFQLMKRMNGE